jgi:hypothetical protein
MVDVFTIHVYEYGALKPDEAILRSGERKENNGGDEPNQGTLYTYTEMSQ